MEGGLIIAFLESNDNTRLAELNLVRRTLWRPPNELTGFGERRPGIGGAELHQRAGLRQG
jgi:hypothetical protein